MKKIILLLTVSLLMLSLFTACGMHETEAGSLNPGPAPQHPEYVPEPLTVEFFNTSYKAMSPWTKYEGAEIEANALEDEIIIENEADSE